MTPAEFTAIKNAYISVVRLHWQGFSVAAAAYFEGNRDKNKGGQEITAEMFMPADTRASTIEADTENRRILEEFKQQSAGRSVIPSWATHSPRCRCKDCRKNKRA